MDIGNKTKTQSTSATWSLQTDHNNPGLGLKAANTAFRFSRSP